ncbi:MAG: regulatory iron-sulfur-containing complex subunit RicT [Bacteroidota bacterium]
MGCGSGGCSSGGCSTGGCSKLNTYDWLGIMEMPAYMKAFDVVEIRFKGTRKEFYKNVNNLDITLGDMVVVEMENGYDIGHVATKGEMCKLQLRKAGLNEEGEFRKIMRRATDADTTRFKENKELEVPTMYKARSISMELGLSMKLSDVEYQGDRRKATFYYTAEDRVDFRELIRKLADSFKVRVEMRQIGYRQEAGRLGAIGSCGRELCCSTWLTDFKLVQTNAARYQNLSLNPLKLSGQCGRLKCCLNYELDTYMEAWKEFPEEDNMRLEFTSGAYKLVKTDILKKMMWFMPLDMIGGEWVNLDVKKVKEYREANKRGEKPELEIRKIIPKVIEFEFKNDMGTESLTRLDERSKPKRSNNNKNKNRNNRNTQNTADTKPAETRQNNPQQNRGPQQPRDNQQPREPRPQQNKPQQNRGPQPPREPRTDQPTREPRPQQNKPQQNRGPQQPRNDQPPREPRPPQNRGPQNNRPNRDPNPNNDNTTKE